MAPLIETKSFRLKFLWGCLLWLKTFDTVEELRLALHEFQRQYNETWLIGRHGYKAPAQVRHEQQCALAAAA
jgi:putative transposase